jgi:lysophospholipase L1-like esterase
MTSSESTTPPRGPPQAESTLRIGLKMAALTVGLLGGAGVGLEYWERHHSWPVADSWYQLSDADGHVVFRCQRYVPVRFTTKPAAGVKRVLVMGGSTTFGFPQHPIGEAPLDRAQHGFVGVLQEAFDRAWPGKVELVNLGVNGGSSADTVRLLRAADDWGVSGVVLYDGHNEFMSVPQQFSAGLWPLALYRRLGALGAPPTQAPGWVGAGSYGGPEHAAAVVRQFRQNFEQIADAVDSLGVPLVVSTQASNLSGLDPSWSMGPTSLDLAAMESWDDPTLEAAWRAHPTVADVAWHAGRRQAARRDGGAGDSWDAFRAAADHDALPFRATSEINDAIRGLGDRPGVFVVDAEQALRDRLGPPGNDHFFDNVHPQPDTAVAIAEVVAVGMATAGLIPEQGLSPLAPTAASSTERVDAELRTARTWLRWAAIRAHDPAHRLDQATRYGESVLAARPTDPDAQALLAAADRLRGDPTPRPMPNDPAAVQRLARVHPALGALVAEGAR